MPLTSSSMWWKIVSARPMTTRPAVSDTIPIHMYGRIVRPRNATDSRPVNTHTEPNEHRTWNKVNILTYKVNILKRVLLHIEPVFCQILHNIVLRFWYPYQVFRTLRLHNCYLDTSLQNCCFSRINLLLTLHTEKTFCLDISQIYNYNENRLRSVFQIGIAIAVKTLKVSTAIGSKM